eukprot:c25739_g1_i1 orf=74-898(+)
MAPASYTLEILNPRKRPPPPPPLPQDSSLLSTCSSSHDSTEPPCAKRTCPSPPCNINYMHPEQGAGGGGGGAAAAASVACSSRAAKHEENIKDYNCHSDDFDEQGTAAACCSQTAKHEEYKNYRSHSDDLDEILGCEDDSEGIGGVQCDADEHLLREMMYSLEQAIGSNLHTEDSSSCSSSPRTNTSSNCSSSRASAWGAIGDDGEPNSGNSPLELKVSFNLLGDCSASIDEEIQAMLQQAEDDVSKIPNFCRNLNDCEIPNNFDYNCIANSAA